MHYDVMTKTQGLRIQNKASLIAGVDKGSTVSSACIDRSGRTTQNVRTVTT